MRRARQAALVIALGLALLGLAGPVQAGAGGIPNEKSCGGIGRDAQTFAAKPGPMIPYEMFVAQGPFTCDDIGGEHGQGF
jgi:hypothetical protein